MLSYLTTKFWRLDSDFDLMKNVLLLMDSVLNVLTSAIHGSSTSICRAKGDEDLLYSASVNITGNIRAYMQHQIRDTQQKLPKVTALQNLDVVVTGVWLKNHCQKCYQQNIEKGKGVFWQEWGDFFLSWQFLHRSPAPT